MVAYTRKNNNNETFKMLEFCKKFAYDLDKEKVCCQKIGVLSRQLDTKVTLVPRQITRYYVYVYCLSRK